MSEEKRTNHDIEPCPDEDLWKEFVKNEIQDKSIRSILEAHIQFCASCNMNVKKLRLESLTQDIFSLQVERFKELSTKALSARMDGPKPGTLWRAVPKSEDDIFGPLLLVIESETGDKTETVRVAPISEEISQAIETDIIIEPDESGLSFTFMVRAGNVIETHKKYLKTYVGGLTKSLTLKIVKFCQKTQTFDDDIPLTDYQFLKDAKGNELMKRRGILSGMLVTSNDDPRILLDLKTKDQLDYLVQDSNTPHKTDDTANAQQDHLFRYKTDEISLGRVLLQVAAVMVAVAATWLLSQMIHKQSSEQLIAQHEQNRKKLENLIASKKEMEENFKKVAQAATERFMKIDRLETKLEGLQYDNLKLERQNAQESSEKFEAERQLALAQRNQNELTRRLARLDPSVKHTDDTTIIAAVISESVWEAARQGDLDVLKKSLQNEAQVNERDPETGMTPLHIAAANGKIMVSQMLIDNDARVNILDFEGQTPLIKAARNGHTEIVRQLLEYGANPNIRDKNGKTALDWASFFKHEDIVRRLKSILKKGQ